MNKAKLKSYAPQARQDFIAAVTARANLLGLSAKTGDQAGQLEVAPAQTQGDVTLIAGQAWPAKVAAQRDQLITCMRREGFAHTCEAVAYTWFNRFAALRYMELHDYLGHGHRALSSAEGNLPDILTHAADLAQAPGSGSGSANDSGLPGLNAAKVLEMKLAGNRDGELYRMLLVAQCNALNAAMPFLFERIDDDTELLLPDNLLRTDSVIAKLVQEIPEEDWAEVEIIGWLYQFYISEKKDQVIGKVVKSEDIPAATQLFTPNWIVQYLVQNSVGRLWLMANPASTLASQWPYYIKPAEQTPEVQAQLDALIQTRMNEDGGSLNPETITVLDPACGSGHILVVAYDVLKAIYLERGYQARAIPRLILEKNLYGLDIDDRAAQMAGFALLMKARADDRRLFNEPPKLNVLSLQESKGLDAAALAQALNSTKTVRTELFEVQQLRWLIDTFEHAKTFGSLIQIDHQPPSKLREMLSIVQQSLQVGDLYAQAAAQDVLPLVQQALVLGMQFDAVVANPPYMGRGGMNSVVKEFALDHFPDAKSDLFACFIQRSVEFTKAEGQIGIVAPYVWMFISAYENLRARLIAETSLASLVQLEYNAFEPACIPVATFALMRSNVKNFVGSYIKLSEFKGHQFQASRTIEAIKNPECGWLYKAKPDEFKRIPGSPLAYWFSESLLEQFTSKPLVGRVASVRSGLSTGDNDRFLRHWREVDFSTINRSCFSNVSGDSKKKWIPYNKGGAFRKLFGNHDLILNWGASGKELESTGDAVFRNRPDYFKEGVTWGGLTSSDVAFRWQPPGSVFDSNKGAMVFASNEMNAMTILGILNSKVAASILDGLNPSLSTQIGDIERIPVVDIPTIKESTEKLVQIARKDWNAFERSWEFESHPIVTMERSQNSSLESSYLSWATSNRESIVETKSLEEENNRILIETYGLTAVLSPELTDTKVTLTVNPAYRYRGELTEEEQWVRFRRDSMSELISYGIGCMMGRYSLDEPGLIYAHAGNVGFDASRYASFPADADGIVPLTDELWFSDDAASRVREFLLAIWGADTLEANMAWLAESLGTKASETPDETVRRYLADKFFKDHLQTYKKRPIYWHFSSGKHSAFQALVYLHRYTEGTLARLRAEYVVPLTGKLQARIAMLQKDLEAASSTAARNKLSKEIEKLKKKRVELLAYDEQLRHYADMRITLDLDDGVKVNYGKFGDLLEGVKLVTGGANED